MELLDRDLVSVQEVRNLIRKAKAAQEKLSLLSGEELNRICEAICHAGLENAKRLGAMAAKETGFGKAEDKTIKNTFASKAVYDYIKDMKTVGILEENKENGVTKIGVPLGVVAALIPSTNPTSTVIYKALIAIKSGNAIIFSPHPGAKECILETVRIINGAAIAAGMPDGAIGAMTVLTQAGTSELMKNKDTAMILATGGSAMVKAAYSSGNPAIGVGPGNGPAFIEKTADIPLAVGRIIASKTFDNGVICASEQSIVVEEVIESQVVCELKKQGGYFLPEEDAKILEKFLLRENGTINPKIVGKSAQDIADFAGISVPKDAKVLIARESRVGERIAYSREKLCPVMAFYVEPSWESACKRCLDILNVEGIGHTLCIHSKDENIIREFALKKPVSRILVNTLGSLGGVGATTNIAPAMTLGCGAVGGSATSDNVTPYNLRNIRVLAYGAREIEDIRKNENMNSSCPQSNNQLVDELVAKILEKLK